MSSRCAEVEIAVCAIELMSIAFRMSDLEHIKRQAAIEKLRTRLTFIRDIKTAGGIQVLGSDHSFLL